MTSEVQELYLNVEDGNVYELWKAILKKYAARSEAQVEVIKAKMEQCSMKAEEQIDVYVARLQLLFSQLLNAGGELSEKTKIRKFLEGLPNQYHGLVDSVRMSMTKEDRDDKLNKTEFDDVVQSMQDKEESMKLRTMKKFDEDQEAAAYAGGMNQQQDRFGGSGSYRGGRGGSHFGHRGSSRGRSPYQYGGGSSGGSGSGSNQPPNYNRACYECGQTDHLKIDCPKLKDRKKCTWCRTYDSHTTCTDECRSMVKHQKEVQQSRRGGYQGHNEGAHQAQEQ